MSFASNTVHGLSADVYFKSVQVRVFGDVTLTVDPSVVELTANDEGNFNPIAILRRGEKVTIGVPVADTQGFATLSGVLFPFSIAMSGVSGALSGSIVLPKSVPGDNYLNKAGELRLVLRDGSATWVFPSAVPTALEDLALSEENQQVWGATFTAFNTTVSGYTTPFYVLSGSHTS